MKLKTKKILKISSGILLGCAFVGTTVYISRSWNNLKTINIGGSSAVMPLINQLSQKYSGVDIVTSAGGSGVGINSILTNSKLIGMASKNPKMVGENNNETKDQETWKKINAKTLTIAWDGIALIYKPSSISNKETIKLDKENFAKLYTAFSGVKELTLDDFLGNGDKTKIKPFARSGGAQISGTADAFFKDSHIDYESSTYWKGLNDKAKEQIKTNLQTGNYGSNVQETAEANKQAWERVKNGPIGSMTYLSAGFVINNKKEIENAGFKVAKYNDKSLYDKNIIAKGYNWYRPFNLMFSLNEIKNDYDVYKMLNWIIFDKVAQDIITNNGFIILNESEWKTMLSPNNRGADKDTITKENLLFNMDASDAKLGYCGAKT